MRRALVTAFLLVLVGCNQQALLEMLASPQDRALAKAQIQALRTGDFDSIEKLSDPQIRTPDFRESLAKMAALVPDGEPQSMKLVGAYKFRKFTGSSTATSTDLTYEYEFSGKWLLINIVTRTTEAGVTLLGFRVVPESQSLAEQNRFTLLGKSPLQYLILLLAVAIPLFSLYALVLCIRTPLRRRKWMWILFILVGVGQLSVNWTTGELSVRQFYLQFLGAGVFASLNGPWIISVSVPLGAILFVLRRNSLRVPEVEAHDDVPLELAAAV